MSDKINQMTEMGKLKGGEEAKGEVKEKTVSTDNPKSSPSVSKETSLSILTQEELRTLDYTDFNTPARMMALGEVLVTSKLITGKTKSDVVVCLMAGKELGLPFIVSLSQIYPIDGKPSLGIHLIRALVIKGGVTFHKLEDAVPLYDFAKKVTDKVTSVGTGPIEDQPEGTVKKLIGYRTTYEFSRQIKRPDGSWRELIGKGSFSTLEAAEAELLEKTNWKRYWRRMLDARAFANGAREVADDIIAGIYTPDELGANSYINDKGEEIIEDISYTAVP